MIPSVYCILLLEDHLDCLSTTCKISKTEKDIEEMIQTYLMKLIGFYHEADFL